MPSFLASRLSLCACLQNWIHFRILRSFTCLLEEASMCANSHSECAAKWPRILDFARCESALGSEEMSKSRFGSSIRRCSASRGWIVSRYRRTSQSISRSSCGVDSGSVTIISCIKARKRYLSRKFRLARKVATWKDWTQKRRFLVMPCQCCPIAHQRGSYF